jgi:predicted Fe-S protein YdhL (DUF1289 family)
MARKKSNTTTVVKTTAPKKTKTDTVASPCIDVCVYGPPGTLTHNLCRGCFRTKDEIEEWTNATNERKREIVLTAKNRKSVAKMFDNQSKID